VAPQKLLSVPAGAEGLRSAGACRGEAGTHVAVFEAVLKVSSANEFVQEASVETVSCPNGVDRLNGE